MWPANGSSMPWNVMSKQTCFLCFFSLNLELPEPSGSPSGTSTCPFMFGPMSFTVFFFLPATAPPTSPNTSATAIAPTNAANGPLRLCMASPLLLVDPRGFLPVALHASYSRLYEADGRRDDWAETAAAISCHGR